MFRKYFLIIIILFFSFLIYFYFSSKQNFSNDFFINELNNYREEIYNNIKKTSLEGEERLYNIFNKIINKFDNHIIILLKTSNNNENIFWSFPHYNFKFDELKNELLLKYELFDGYNILVYNNPYYKKSIFDYLIVLFYFALILFLISSINNKKVKYLFFFIIFILLFFINFSYFTSTNDITLDIDFIFFFPLNIFFYIHGIIFLILLFVFFNINLKKDFLIENRKYIFYVVLQWIFIFFILGGIFSDSREYILNFKTFLPFDNDSMIYFILLSLVMILIYQIKDFAKLCKSRFIILFFISLGVLLYFSLNLFIGIIFIIIYSLFLIFNFFSNRIIILVSLFLSLFIIFFVEIMFQWTKTKEVVKDFSGFIFDNDLEKYKDPNRMILFIPYIRIKGDYIEKFNLPYMYLKFFEDNKEELLSITKRIEVGSFFYSGSKFYFVFLNNGEEKYFFPFLEKNLQFWIDNYQIFGVLPQELSSIIEYSNRCFPIYVGEYYNYLYKGNRYDIFPQNLHEVKESNNLFNYIDIIDDENVDGHTIVIYISNISPVNLIAFIFKSIIFIFILFLFYLLWEIVYHDNLNIFNIIKSRIAYKYVFLEFLVLIISSVILYFILFFYLNFIIIEKDREQYKRANKEVNNYFRFNINVYVDKIRMGAFDEHLGYFYIFDNNGQLIHSNNSDDSFFNDQVIDFIEKSWDNSYSFYYYKNHLFIVSVYPEYEGDIFLGKIVLFYKISYNDIIYFFNALNVKFAIYYNGKIFNFPINYEDFPDLINYSKYLSLKEKGDSYFILNNNIYFLLESDIDNFDNNMLFFVYKSEFNYELLYSLYDKLLVILFVILLLFSIIIIFWNKRISHNTELIIKKLPLVLKKGSRYKIDIVGNDEISKIAKTINFLSENLEKERKKVFDLERDRLINQLAREIAHEIKNPLTPMKLSIQHLMDLYRIDKEKFLKTFPEIAQQFEYSIDLLASLSRKFLDMAKMDLGELEYINIVDVIKDIIVFFNSKKIDFIKFENNLSDNVQVKANKDSLFQVFINIVNNAIQACDKEKCFVIIKLHSDDDKLIIDIIDNGKGVEEEILNKIFEPYFTTKNSGSGLGLAISKRFIELMGGKISAFNLDGQKGFVVRIIFNRKEGQINEV